MSAYKQFLASDIIVTPFEVNKSFNFEGAAALTGSNVSIDRYLGKNILSNPFTSGSNPTTGQVSTQDQELVYNSVKELYYSNHLSSSYGDPVNTSSLIPGTNEEGNALSGSSPSSGRYVEYPQSDINYQKYFPTGSNSVIGVLSIPSRLFGDYIQPNSFNWIAESGSIYDDGEGNLILSSTGEICGNIFYYHGIAVLTSDSVITDTDTYGTGIYGTAVYSLGDANFIDNFITSSNTTCSFSSSYSIYETQYKCTLRESEFNFSLNPSLISGSTDGTVYDFVTGSYFSPYVTTVGLYDENQNLLAIGKLSQPLPTSPTTDTTILINLDR